MRRNIVITILLKIVSCIFVALVCSSAEAADTDFVSVRAGASFNLALKTDGSIIGWGYNYNGQADPPPGNDFVSIAAGDYHSLALKTDGSIVSWGADWYGPPPDGNDFMAIAAGHTHSLALKTDGSIVGWGNNYDGQADPPEGNDFMAIAAGYSHSLALKTDGSIVGWGGGDYSQADPPAGNDFVAIAAGIDHSLALKTDGSIVGWGGGDYGQANPPNGNDFNAIAAGHLHSLARKTDGSVIGWGADWAGQASPPSGNDFSAIAAGIDHSIALKTDGSVVGWGYNSYGQAEPPGSGSISGRVLRHSDGVGLADIEVELYTGNDANIADNSAWNYRGSTITDPNGGYRFDYLTQRKYHVRIENQDVSGTHYLEADLYNVQVLEGVETGDMDFRLRGAGSIYGHVTSAAGTPIQYARVVAEAAWTEYGQRWHDTQTDQDGRYEFWVLPSPGKFYPVWVERAFLPGKAYKVYGGSEYLSGSDSFHPEEHGYSLLGEGTNTQHFNGAHTYYIIVTEEGNLAKVDAVEGSDHSYYGTYSSGNTLNSGNVAGAPDGQFASVGGGSSSYPGGYILIEPASGNTSLTVYIVDDGRSDDPTSYESKWDGNLYKAALGGTQGPEFLLDQAGAVTGRVVNESGVGIQGVRVGNGWSSRYGSVVNSWVVTDSNGYFEFGGLPPGINYIFLENAWLEIQQDGIKYMVGEAYAGPLSIFSGQTIDVGTFTIYQAGMVTGVVTDEAGLPIVAAEVEARGRDIDGYWAMRGPVITDPLGQFTLDYLAPGTYVLSCRKDGFISTRITDVRVRRGEQVDHDVVLKSAARGATISGSITNYSDIAAYDSENGVYYPYYHAGSYHRYGFPEFGLIAIRMGKTLTDEDYLNMGQYFVGQMDDEDIDDGYDDYFETDANETPGSYTMALPSGDIAIGMQFFEGDVPGWGGSAILYDWKRYNLTEGHSQVNMDFAATATNTGTLKGNLLVPSEYDNLVSNWCLIWARALDPNGNIMNSWLLGDAVAFPGWTTTYEFRGLPVGNYRLQAFARNLPSVLDIPPVTVESGLTTTQNIDFTSVPSGMLTGHVSSGVSDINNALVTIIENGRQTTTDNSGNYAISGINTGIYTVAVTALGYADAQAAVIIDSGSNAQNFALDANVGSISGTVKDISDANINGATVLAYNETNNTHKTATTVGGAFSIPGLTPGQYILAVNMDDHGVVVYPEGASRIELSANQNITGINITVGTPQPPVFTVSSSASDTEPVVLSMEFYSDKELVAEPAVVVVDGNGVLNSLTPNNALNHFRIGYTADVNDNMVRIRIQETTPLVPGNAASKSFTFEVGENLVATSSTNVTNATGGRASIMGTQDNTMVYVPPFAIAGTQSDSQAVTLTVVRYGDPGDAVEGTDTNSVSAVYDFSFDDEGVSIDENHTFTVTMSFQLPQGMTQEEFERFLVIQYFDAGEQRWKTDGISNVRTNWSSWTIMFEISHLTRFAAFVDTGDGIIGDFCGADFGPPDGYVDVWDLMCFADHWHTSEGDADWDATFDLAGGNFGDPDGYVDVWDLMMFADHWHEGEKP